MQIVSIPKRRAALTSTLAIAEDSRMQGVPGGDADITVDQMVACYLETCKDEFPLISKFLSLRKYRGGRMLCGLVHRNLDDL